MNTPNKSPLVRASSTALLVALLFFPRPAHAQSANDAPPPAPLPISEADFPYAINIKTWLAQEGFRRGDRLQIESVKGNRPTIEPGGSYLVQGTYTLGSAPSARLMLSLTSKGDGGRGTTAATQRMKIDQGTGAFTLATTMRDSGQLHVSFYFADPNDPRRSSSGGGLYFDNR
jgi:hypothetical protein